MKGLIVFFFISSLMLASSADLKSCGSVKSGEFLANKENPKIFFVCVNGYLMELECAKYLNFDNVRDVCTGKAQVTP